MRCIKFDDFELNPVHIGDAWKICNLCVANQSRFKRFFPKTLEQNLTPTLSQLFVESKVKQFENKEVFLFTLKHSETKQLVGLFYIKELDWKKKQGEFAYCIDYVFEGKGLTKLAIKHLSSHAFSNLGLNTLQIIVHKANIGSVKVAEANNFKRIKTLQNEYKPLNEQALDMDLYELHH